MRRGLGGHVEGGQGQGPKRFSRNQGLLYKSFKRLPFVAAELPIEDYDSRAFFGALKQASVN
jgi:hypothetical protein